jgi:hypothetical protein
VSINLKLPSVRIRRQIAPYLKSLTTLAAAWSIGAKVTSRTDSALALSVPY